MDISEILDTLSSIRDEVRIIGISNRFMPNRTHPTDLSVEPDTIDNYFVSDLITDLSSIIGKPLEGYDKKTYKIFYNSNIYIAYYGSCGRMVTGIHVNQDKTLEFI